MEDALTDEERQRSIIKTINFHVAAALRGRHDSLWDAVDTLRSYLRHLQEEIEGGLEEELFKEPNKSGTHHDHHPR
jgi:hypothetical protein